MKKKTQFHLGRMSANTPAGIDPPQFKEHREKLKAEKVQKKDDRFFDPGKNKNWLTVLIVALFATTASAQIDTIPASAKKYTVYGVHDGDTFNMVDSTRRIANGRLYRFGVRLYGVNAPEVWAPGYSITQTYGVESGDKMRSVFKGRAVWVDSVMTDVYNNPVCIVYIQDSTGVWDAGTYAVANGLAWAQITKRKRNRTDYDNRLITLQDVARREKRGLWAVSKDEKGSQVQPWVWRKKMTGN